MLSVLLQARKSMGKIVLLLGIVVMAACTPTTTPVSGAGGGKVQIALLVPGGSGQASDELLATSLQNAARLAISDLGNSQIDLRVYNTAGQPSQAAAMASKAVDDGAQIILGPVYAQEANAAGLAVKGSGINVLSFSNNTDVAGGNVFVLGPTFANSAHRLASYAVRSGKSKIMIVHDLNTAGQIGRAATEQGVAAAGGQVVAINGYEFSQNGIVQAGPVIAAAAKSNGAQAIFFTADTAGALPLITQMLADQSVTSAQIQFVGLTRWDVPTATLSLPGVQGGIFALPDPGLFAQYQSRYQAAYSEPPHPISGLAYDGIAAIGALLKQGTTGIVTREALTQGSGFVGVNGVFRLRGDGTNERGLAIARVSDGQAIVIDPAPRSFGGAGF
ncbi:MAG: hypothetical protein RIR95_2124 [Pseudomonadota bacterium]|jgi:ABC-type branched-subunit amino acid transport system substrate-binding protein